MACTTSSLYTSPTSTSRAPLNTYHDQSLSKLHLNTVTDGILLFCCRYIEYPIVAILSRRNIAVFATQLSWFLS